MHQQSIQTNLAQCVETAQSLQPAAAVQAQIAAILSFCGNVLILCPWSVWDTQSNSKTSLTSIVQLTQLQTNLGLVVNVTLLGIDKAHLRVRKVFRVMMHP